MRRLLFLLFLFVAHFIEAQKGETPYVLLISFDGFRYDYVSKFNPPHFKEFIKNGVAADLIPSFPSKTFPNHYTLVTGLYPGHHGLVDNQFYDPEQKVKYSIKNPSTVVNPSFYGGTPLWQLAQQQGLKTASFFWVGSEAPIQGVYPTYYFRFDDSYPNEKRIDQTIDWLKLPEEKRPHFISIYFSSVDHAGHDAGPSSDVLKRAVLEADTLLGNLMQQLKNLAFPVNVIIVSDHGMLDMKASEETYITLSKLFNTEDSSTLFTNGGTQVQLYTKNSDSLYQILKPKEEHFKIYKKGETPPYWHYKNDRSGDLLMVADPGYFFQINSKRKDDSAPLYTAFGAHGFDPYAVQEMRGIFYASGPNIKSGAKIKPFENIHIYPFIAKILDLKIPPIDGDVKVLDKIYQK